jgi:Kef-type K+ transport system membrane component KefB
MRLQGGMQLINGAQEGATQANWIFELAVILLAAKLGAEIFNRLRQSPMLGEILAGVILGPSVLALFHESDILDIFAEIGIIFMIFMLGLETNVANLRKVGGRAAAIAVAGIVVPFAAGWFLGKAIGSSWETSLFFGAILTATSVAITARTLMDMDLTRSKLAQTILAAAVIDDIAGLLVLAIVLTVTGGGEQGGIGLTLTKEGIFLLIIFPVFWYGIPLVTRWLKRLEGEGALFVMVLGLTFLFSYLAQLAGLATIVGAFLIGLIFGRTSEGVSIQEQVEPIYFFMAPIFFVSIGIAVHLDELWATLVFALIFSAVAVATKILGGALGGMVSRMRLSAAALVGIGMIPRGEVGLIVADLGLEGGIIDQSIFSAAAFMSVVTILVTPTLLKWTVKRYYREEA